MNVTYGAVSRQIRLLVVYLGVSLSHRRSNSVELTKAREQLHRFTRTAFSAQHLGVQGVRRLPHRHAITVSLSTSLALKWLVPTLSSFQQKHSGISLLLDTNHAFVDFDASEVDVALRFGEPSWNGLHHEPTKPIGLVVVAAPSLPDKTNRPMRAEDIIQLSLLQDAFNAGWKKRAAQVSVVYDWAKIPSIKYADGVILLEAAIDGHGVALARHLLEAPDQQLGRLLRLDTSKVQMDRGLYFVRGPEELDRVPVEIFKKWHVSIGMVG